MKFFLDTANLESIRIYNEMGIVDGVTTNPTLLSKETGNPNEIMRQIVQLVKGPVSLEVTGTDKESMIEEGYRLSNFGKNVVVKIPMTVEGLKAVKKLSDEGIKINVTLIFSASQAIIASKAGASYVSPFIGRLDDIGYNGMSLINDIVQIFKNYKFSTEVLVASVRHPIHVIEAAKIGADIATLPPDVLHKLLLHPLTDKGLSLFLSDWEKVKKANPNILE